MGGNVTPKGISEQNSLRKSVKNNILIFYRTQVSLGSDLWVRSLTNSVRDVVADLTDVTLADEDTKPILTDNAKRAIQGNVAMHVNHPVNLVVKF